MPDETIDVRVPLPLDDHVRLTVQAALARQFIYEYVAIAIMQKVDEDEANRAKQASRENQARIRAEEKKG